MSKMRVALFGASGTMGFEAFKELWRRRERYEISILVLPQELRLGRFRPFGRAAGAPELRGPGLAQGDGLRIVCGDATQPADVAATLRGADAVLNAMACISPAADYHPERARAVNVAAVAHILRAIEAEPDGAARIAYVHTASVAQTGNRPPGIHVGRVGDPLKPSVFDAYALTKIAGERLVLESRLRRWVSLRMSFILPTTHRALLALEDPILYHMPLDTRMECITDRDAGFGLVQCLEVLEDSGFWRRVYNMSGGPPLRAVAQGFLADNYRRSGLRFEACAERDWFALRNFHLQYFEDGGALDAYLHHARDSFESFWAAIDATRPPALRLLRALAARFPLVQRLAARAVRARARGVVETHPNSPRAWVLARNDLRVRAFYGSYARAQAIPGWEAGPVPEDETSWVRLDHGYDEAKAGLDLEALRGAARFRGGRCVSRAWDGDLYAPLDWACAFGHAFAARPYTVIKAGHWCPTCVATWNGGAQARRSAFYAQVWTADHDPTEDDVYPADCILDIAGADRRPRRTPALRRRPARRAGTAAARD